MHDDPMHDYPIIPLFDQKARVRERGIILVMENVPKRRAT